MVLDSKAGVGPELGNVKGTPDLELWHTRLGPLLDAFTDVEASEVSSSEVQKVQFEIAR